MFRPDWLVVVSAGIPLAVAVRANRGTSLFHATIWAWAAWGAWVLAGVGRGQAETYLALALTGCAGVAVLGARRPGVAAWNFVVAGLLVVLLLPLAEAMMVGRTLWPDTVRAVFLASLVGITVINYLPTRLGVAAALMGAGSGLALAGLSGEGMWHPVDVWCVGLAPWVAWPGVAGRAGSTSATDRLWRAMRDRFGYVWGQRVREQFNRAAANAGLNVELRWSGLRPADAATAYDLLAAITKRFGLP